MEALHDGDDTKRWWLKAARDGAASCAEEISWPVRGGGWLVVVKR